MRFTVLRKCHVSSFCFFSFCELSGCYKHLQTIHVQFEFVYMLYTPFTHATARYCSLNIPYRTSSEMRLRGSGGYRLYIGWRSETSWCHLSQTSMLYSIKSSMENKHWLGLRNLRVLVFDIIWHMIWACRSPTMIEGCCGNTAFGLMRLSGHELIPTWHLRNAAIATPLYYRMVPPN